LDIIDEGVNSKIQTLLEYWGFHSKNVDDAWHLLEWIACDSFKFEKATIISKYSFPDPCGFCSRSYYAPFWCELCNSSDHDINSCPYYAYCAQPGFASPVDNIDVVLSLYDSSFPLAQCTGLEVGDPFGVVTRHSIVDACFES